MPNRSGETMPIAIATVFTCNRIQTVRLPTEIPLPDEIKRVVVHIWDGERIFTLPENTWDYFFQKGSSASDDFMNERGEQKPVQRESL